MTGSTVVGGADGLDPASPFIHPTEYWHSLPDGRVQCDLCPRACSLREGQRGLCFVRANLSGAVVSTTYGRSSGFCVDPIEKKPLNHFYPGSSVLSFGTAGCNLSCKFCQNWDISKSRQMDTLASQAAPERIARAAVDAGCRSVAYTYNDPVIFQEYAVDVAQACRELGVLSVAVSAGYHCPEPRQRFYQHMDAANIDLKSFNEEFYWKLTGAHLAPVLDTLQYIHHETSTWLEITTLVIPDHNDSVAELESMCSWIREALGPQVPLHFSAFHPDYKMTGVPATPRATLLKARDIAIAQGLQFVYTGNVHHRQGDTTFCPGCGEAVIERDWYELTRWGLNAESGCQHCGTTIAGRFDPQPGHWGRKRRGIEITE
ncbi:AmmeMemoRadiSam system radical SAM enzyme [Ketobacter sp.]|uniref:AmmeMemoRadiSam system radical SAM enzyme n=1 Tax=Ketobacter sp. TaxID=2083498 RepID=UPI000F1671C0|nr:AmmeMemoRadiSam system radical SAM enzyme [Ketobacter sp.]RLU01633.1 MAG: AmmeMemoRadiSam system radical SAM enzyme [Ketobacter sp.]